MTEQVKLPPLIKLCIDKEPILLARDSMGDYICGIGNFENSTTGKTPEEALENLEAKLADMEMRKNFSPS